MPDKHETYKIYRQGDNVAALLDKIERIGLATRTTPGLITAEDKSKLDDLSIVSNTTEFWNAARGYIPKVGELVIYTDYRQVYSEGKIVNIAGMKIGTGNAYVQDLVFLNNDAAADISEHIMNNDIHVTAAKQDFWNNKLNVTDSQEVIGEALVFNRN